MSTEPQPPHSTTPAPSLEFSGDASLALGHVVGWRTFDPTTPPPSGSRLIACSFRLSGMVLFSNLPPMNRLELRFLINRGRPGARTMVTHIPFEEGGIDLSFNFTTLHPPSGGVVSVDVMFGKTMILRREISFP